MVAHPVSRLNKIHLTTSLHAHIEMNVQFLIFNFAEEVQGRAEGWFMAVLLHLPTHSAQGVTSTFSTPVNLVHQLFQHRVDAKIL